MSYEAVEPGEIAAVVTYLEMSEPPAAGDGAAGDSPSARDCPLALCRIEHPGPEQYRALFRRIGAPWLWFSRLVMDDDALAAILHDPSVELFEVRDPAGAVVGMLELDFREPGQCELAFVGLVPELSGLGHGRWLLGEAVSRAWRDGVSRVHVHTCSLDHPAAVSAYRRAGFVAVKRAIEHFADPRLSGILPRDCAPQIPLID